MGDEISGKEKDFGAGGTATFKSSARI